MRRLLIALPLLFAGIAPAQSQVSVGISVSMPGIDIGINLPTYPQLVPVPGYPVYYDPRGSANYFFYDGLYWAYRNDNWYASSWYNGPWRGVVRESVPFYVLRVPVRYYRQPPPYFRGWRADAPPRWGEHWGPEWESKHRDWDHWDHQRTPKRAPLPAYQHNYPGKHYPHEVEKQRDLEARNYHYQPHEPEAQQHAPKSSAERPSQGKGDGGHQAAGAEKHERKDSKNQERKEAQHGHEGG
ncbi:MAG: hypothetical protein ABI633_11585 [Burkholderiales bacterium]